MIDFHSHILPNIDDGSTSVEESINLIKEASQVGFTGIITTSHYMNGYYECEEERRKQIIEELVQKIKRNDNCKIPELYLGNEIYITTDMVELIKSGKASTINRTSYVLFELPMNSKPLFDKDVIYKLIENGYRPIIAHPERYSYIKANTEYAQTLKNMGALFQSNYGSIIGLYGNEAKRTLKKLLKMDLISFLGSDVHTTNQIYPKIPKALKKLEKIISTEKLEKLTTLNAQKILNNEEV